MRIDGVYAAGDEPGTFIQMVQLRAERYRTDVVTGESRSGDGLDGEAWASSNGIVTIVDLPALEQDVRARGFLLREGWREPGVVGTLAPANACDAAAADCVVIRTPAGTPATLWFDSRTHLPLKAILDVDDGRETTIYADWRGVEGTRVAFRRTVSDQTGASVSYIARSVTFAEGAGRALARPAPRSHGRLAVGRPTRIPFVFTGGDRGHIVVPATVDGKAVQLIFDSGGANYFTPASARALGITIAGGVNIGGVGETSETGGYGTVQTLSIGTATLDDEMALVGPLPYPAIRPRAGLSVSGLTGYEFLSEFRTTIDYAAREIAFDRFGRPARPGSAIPFYSDGHSIYVEAAIDGATGLFRLDTGDGGALTVFRSFADRQNLFASGGTATRLAGGVGGWIVAREVVGRDFVLAGSHLTDIPVSISDTSAGAFSSRTLAGNLGSAILSRFTLTFDYRARTVTFLPNARLRQPFDRERTGLSLDQQRPEDIAVLSVAAGSPAAAAGVRVGDRVVAIDGRSVRDAKLGVFDLTPLRFGTVPFRLSLVRADTLLEVVVRPFDWER